MIYWDLLILSGAAATAIVALRNRIRPKHWVEIHYYEWVRATRRGDRTLTTRDTTGRPTRYWLLEQA
jgi:hypothetical protein